MARRQIQAIFSGDSLTSGDPFDEFYDPAHPSSQSLTQLDLTQLDVLGFNTVAATFSWATPEDGDFASASNWTSGGTSPSTTSPVFNDNVLITVSGASSYTVSSLANETINSLVMAAGAMLDIISGVFTIDNGTNFYTTSGIIEVSGGATLVLVGEVVNAGTIDATGGTIELSATISGAGANLVSSGGTLLVALGGSAASVTVSSGGTESGGSILAGSQVVFAGGTANAATVNGGTQLVSGFASGGSMLAGAQVVAAGGTASALTIKGGRAPLARPSSAASRSSSPAAPQPVPRCRAAARSKSSATAFSPMPCSSRALSMRSAPAQRFPAVRLLAASHW
jgi:autotransporter passenger strand-loop-strand repeat protein